MVTWRIVLETIKYISSFENILHDESQTSEVSQKPLDLYPTLPVPVFGSSEL